MTSGETKRSSVVDYPEWSATFGSVAGPKRATRGGANQDAALILPESRRGTRLAAAIADGHGSARYVRSGIGAQIAVRMAVQHLLELSPEDGQEIPLTDIKRAVTERLPLVFYREWTARVGEHLAAHPLSADEIALLQASGASAWEAFERRPERIYGTTLLAVLIEPRFGVFVQLGDGDMLISWQNGDVTTAFPSESQQLGDETESFANSDAWRNVHVSFQPLVGDVPLLIILATDGYTKAFRNDDAVLQVARDMQMMVLDNGFDLIEQELESWLLEAANVSGDDATAVVMVRRFAIDERRHEPHRSEMMVEHAELNDAADQESPNEIRDSVVHDADHDSTTDELNNVECSAPRASRDDESEHSDGRVSPIQKEGNEIADAPDDGQAGNEADPVEQESMQVIEDPDSDQQRYDDAYWNDRNLQVNVNHEKNEPASEPRRRDDISSGDWSFIGEQKDVEE